VLRYPALRGKDKHGHPSPKPVPLLGDLIGTCPPGMIADPFAGVGSTLIAARDLGIPSIGVEIEERYCETAALRLSLPRLACRAAS
jgi:site-specific DNA-methyltransferase (adenine-specific)